VGKASITEFNSEWSDAGTGEKKNRPWNRPVTHLFFLDEAVTKLVTGAAVIFPILFALLARLETLFGMVLDVIVLIYSSPSPSTFNILINFTLRHGLILYF
jgi:hypothetical protein